MNIETKNRIIEAMKNTIGEQLDLNKKNEKALEEITRQYDNTTVNRAKEIANEALGELTDKRRRKIQEYRI